MIREEIGKWFVWTKTGHRPTHAHDERGGAEAEAQRLAMDNPGKKFIVLFMADKFHQPRVALAEPVHGDPMAELADAAQV